MAESMLSVQLTVADIGTTEAFYGGILELSVTRALAAPGAPEHLLVRHDGCQLIFAEEEAIVRAHPVLEERLAAFPKGVGVTLRIRVSDLEGISDALDEEGLEILYPLAELPYGGKELWCFDPDGYLVVLEELTRR